MRYLTKSNHSLSSMLGASTFKAIFEQHEAESPYPQWDLNSDPSLQQRNVLLQELQPCLVN